MLEKILELNKARNGRKPVGPTRQAHLLPFFAGDNKAAHTEAPGVYPHANQGSKVMYESRLVWQCQHKVDMCPCDSGLMMSDCQQSSASG